MAHYPDNLFGLLAGRIAAFKGWYIYRSFAVDEYEGVTVTLLAQKVGVRLAPLRWEETFRCFDYNDPKTELINVARDLEANLRHAIVEVEDLEASFNLSEKTTT